MFALIWLPARDLGNGQEECHRPQAAVGRNVGLHHGAPDVGPIGSAFVLIASRFGSNVETWVLQARQQQRNSICVTWDHLLWQDGNAYHECYLEQLEMVWGRILIVLALSRVCDFFSFPTPHWGDVLHKIGSAKFKHNTRHDMSKSTFYQQQCRLGLGWCNIVRLLWWNLLRVQSRWHVFLNCAIYCGHRPRGKWRCAIYLGFRVEY